MSVRILLVDDEPALLDIISIFLKKIEGFTIECVTSGQEALDKLHATDYDVIVSDYMMPGMNGIDLLKTLRAEGNHTPFIIFTGKGKEDVAIEALNHGAMFFIPKEGDARAQIHQLKNMILLAEEQKRSEEELKKSEAKYRTLVESTHDSIYMVDRQCRYIFMNTHHQQRLRVSGKNFLQQPYSAFHTPSESDTFREKVKRVFVTGESLTDEQERGGKYYIRNFSPVRDDESEEVVAVTIISHDQTEQKKSHEVASLLAAIVKSSGDAIISRDLNGNITTWNVSAERMLGFHEAEMVSGTGNLQIPPDLVRENGPLNEETMKSGRSLSLETKMRRKDGSDIDVLVSVSPIRDENQSIIGQALIIRDLTAQRETEQALVAFITEAALRLKNPVEMIGTRLADVRDQIGRTGVTDDEIRLQLDIQIKNAEQIVKNLQELNQAILKGYKGIPDAYREYLIH